MSHSNTQRFTDYWQSRRGAGGRAPLRASIDPHDFTDLLPQVFILGRQAAGRYVFRLSGGLVETLHGGGLRYSEFAPLWRLEDRIGLQTAMEGALRGGQAIVVEARAQAGEGYEADLEILLAPMISASGVSDRFVGLYQAIGSLRPLEGRPIRRLTALAVRLAAPDEAADPFMPRLKLAALDGRRIA